MDEAVKQLSFLNKKGAAIAKEVILEAQRLAVEEHNVEFKSNLWVGEYQLISETLIIYQSILFFKSSNNSIDIVEIKISFVAESFSNKGIVIKGLRRHAKGRSGIIHYRYCHYFVRLEEGPPPKHYYLPYPKTGEELLNNWLEAMHNRKVTNSL